MYIVGGFFYDPIAYIHPEQPPGRQAATLHYALPAANPAIFQ
jgi:hypothetical protein